ncbi:Vesicle-associated protein 1-1 [Rhynchospora pubera]|uniref:Vesicle-associated protein 1-1 n=1 Tax=Rhynchospora pubera TaxID=906938 RepID=A0AAV8E942_9POAL|nr:Vesicle-associated protein 1-1 [Rhynchospora pubera]
MVNLRTQSVLKISVVCCCNNFSFALSDLESKLQHTIHKSMGQDLVEIEPRELKFPFELKKQSSCSIHLVNKSNDYVAFKVKTTSPKRYCVRPNIGVILPMSSSEFTVTMQGQKTAPPDMQLKDKFLVQVTVVPFGTTEEDIIPEFFSKESGRYIEESKLRVVLISPPNSPEHVLHHASNGNGSLNSVSPRPGDKEAPSLKDNQIDPRVESPSTLMESSAFTRESPIFTKTKDSPIFTKESPVFTKESPTFTKESRALLGDSPRVAVKDSQIGFVKAENLQFSHVSEDVENLKLKVNTLESKLQEAEKMIVRLRDESTTTVQERDTLLKEMVTLRRKTGGRSQVGFPFLFVVYMALVGVALGYFMHP